MRAYSAVLTVAVLSLGVFGCGGYLRDDEQRHRALEFHDDGTGSRERGHHRRRGRQRLPIVLTKSVDDPRQARWSSGITSTLSPTVCSWTIGRLIRATSIQAPSVHRCSSRRRAPITAPSIP